MVLTQCGVCQAFEKAPLSSVAGTSTAAALAEKLQVHLLSWAISSPCVLRASSLSTPSSFPFVRKIPRMFGAPFGIHGFEWPAFRFASRWMRAGNGRTIYGRNCAPNDRLNCLFEASVRAPGFLNAATAWPHSVYNRLNQDDRFLGAQIPAEAQWRRDSLISGSGFSAN